MPKDVRKAVEEDKGRRTGPYEMDHVGGAGFQKRFSKDELEDIRTKRKDMHDRLFSKE